MPLLGPSENPVRILRQQMVCSLDRFRIHKREPPRPEP